MTRSDVLNYETMDNIDIQRAKVLSTLNYHQTALTRNLTISQERLSQALKQLANPEEKK